MSDSALVLTTAEAALILKTNPRTLERWRSTGSGPVYIKVGRRAAYRLRDLERWLDAQSRTHTKEQPGVRAQELRSAK